MSTRQPIVVGVDASWQAGGAVDWALREAHLRDLPIHAVHVVEEKQLSAAYFTGPAVDEAAKGLAAAVDDYLAGHDDGAGHTSGVLIGRPAVKLVKAAKGSSMLVVGRRGTGVVARLLLGSTAEAVAHLSAVPVVVVPDRWQPQYAGAPVVVGVSEEDEDDAAIEFAVSAAAVRGAPVLFVRAWDLPALYTWDAASVTDLYDGWLEKSEKLLEALAGRWQEKYPDLKIEALTRRGHPVAALIAAAEEHRADLLVLGGRHHNRVAEAILGSTARGVLHHAPCPVAVVHEPRHAE